MDSSLKTLREYVEQRQPLDQDGAVARMDAFMASHRQTCQWFWNEAQTNHAYAGGKQWPAEIYEARLKSKRPSLSVNTVEVAIDSFTGRLQTERFKASVAPESYEEPLAGPLDQFCTEQRRRSDGEANTEDAFRDMWIGRVGVERISVHEDGPVLVEKREVVPLWEMVWDTKSRKQNFADRVGHMHGRYVHATEFRALATKLGVGEDKTEEFFTFWRGLGKRGKTSGDSQGGQWPINIKDVWLVDLEQVFIRTIEWRDRERCVELRLPEPLDQLVLQHLRDDPHADETVLMALAQAIAGAGEQLGELTQQPKAKLGWMLTEADFKALEQVWLKVGAAPIPEHFFRRLSRWRYYRANMVGETLLGAAELIPEQRFTYLFMTDNMIKDPVAGHRPRSYVESMKDSQNSQNRALSGLMDAAGRSIKNVLLYTKGLFANVGTAQEQLSVDSGMIECNAPPVKGQNFELLQTKPSDTYEKVWQILRGIFAEERIGPYEQGGVENLARTSSKTVTSVTHNARSKQASRYRAYSLALKEEVALQVHQAHAYYSYEEMLDILGPGFTTKELDPNTGQEVEIPLLPPDRRLWLHALRRQVAVTESAYTEVERDELLAKLHEHGYWQLIAQVLPPQYAVQFLFELTPSGISAHNPKAFKILREAVEVLSQPPQPPPEGQQQLPPGTPPN